MIFVPDSSIFGDTALILGALNVKRPYFVDLQNASYRGVPFGVFGGSLTVGRKTAMHEYPFKDVGWVEDLGKQSRKYTLNAFLIEGGGKYGGSGSAVSQRQALIDACETSLDIDGQLVHPSLGTINVSLISAAFDEDVEHGRVFKVQLVFVQSGNKSVTSSVLSTQSALVNAATAATPSFADAFLAKISSAKSSIAAISQAISTVEGYAAKVISIVRASTSLINMVSSLGSGFGVFVGQFTSPFTALLSSFSSLKSAIAGLIGLGASERQTAVTSLGSFSRAVSGTATSAVSQSNGSTALANIDAPTLTAKVVASVLSANSDPKQAIQGMLDLQLASPQVDLFGDASIAGNALHDLFRRHAIAGLANAVSNYYPISRDDAQTVMSTVVSAVEKEITIAGNQGEDAVYLSLRNLKTAMVQDLRARGASLADTQLIETPSNMPSLYLAQKVYQDSSREIEMVRAAKPIHPAFMPTEFRALSK